MIRELRAFREQWNAIQTELQEMPEEPQPPQLPLPFTGMDAEAAKEMVRKDAAQFAAISGTKGPLVLMVVGVLGLISAAALIFLRAYAFGGISGAAGLAALVWGIWERSSSRERCSSLLKKYGHGHWKNWGDPISAYERAAPFFFLKTTLAIWGLSCFHVNCEIFCSSSVKKCHW